MTFIILQIFIFPAVAEATCCVLNNSLMMLLQFLLSPEVACIGVCSSQVSGFSRVPLNHAAYLVAFSISFVSASYRVSPYPLQQGRANPGTKIVTAIGFYTLSRNVCVHSIKLVLYHPCGAWIFGVFV